jgi:hypothetical protein
VSQQLNAVYVTKKKNDKKSQPVFHKDLVKISAPKKMVTMPFYEKYIKLE